MTAQDADCTAKLEQAAKLRASGAKWADIERVVGLSAHRIRYAIDPDFAGRRRSQISTNRDYQRSDLTHFVDRHVTPAQAAAALATVPPDTRPYFAKLMGDPLPGRSALDRRALLQLSKRIAIGETATKNEEAVR